MNAIHVIIPAAGSGSRLGGNTPKQYSLLAGKPILHYSLALFCQHPDIQQVHLALHPQDQAWQKLNDATPFQHRKLNVLHTGGATRAATVLNTLLAIQAHAQDWVLVHDAARPGLNRELLDGLLKQICDDDVGGILALPISDTVKRADQYQRIVQTEPREGLWAAQTPQMFRYATLTQALQQADFLPTDEAQAIEALGLKPKLVAGAPRNLKITYPHDLILLQAILQSDGEATT